MSLEPCIASRGDIVRDQKAPLGFSTIAQESLLLGSCRGACHHPASDQNLVSVSQSCAGNGGRGPSEGCTIEERNNKGPEYTSMLNTVVLILQLQKGR